MASRATLYDDVAGTTRGVLLGTGAGTPADDGSVVHNTGTETINGAKTFGGNVTIQGTVSTQAHVALLTTTTAAATLVTTTREMLNLDATTAAFTVTLPAASGSNIFQLVKTDSTSNAITIRPNGTTDTIMGLTFAQGGQIVLNAIGDWVLLHARGTNWVVLSRGPGGQVDTLAAATTLNQLHHSVIVPNGTALASLPACANYKGRDYYVTNLHTAAVALAANGTDKYLNVSGQPSSYSIPVNGTVHVRSTGTGWIIQ